MIQSFLENRKFCVKINDYKSNYLNTHFGVPQGCILSPTLYSIYVHDMEYKINEYIIQYADDTAIIIDYSNIDDLQNKISTCYDKTIKYLEEHNLLLNLDKTEIILFNEKNETSIYFGKMINTVSEAKFLGYYINKNMYFRENINTLKKKITNKLPLVYSIRHILPENIKRIIYFSMIYSNIQYFAPFLLGNKEELKNLEKNHKKLIKILFNFKKLTPTDEVYKSTKLKPLENIIQDNLYNFAEKIKNNNTSRKIISNFNCSNIRKGRYTLLQSSLKFSYYNEVTKLMNN